LEEIPVPNREAKTQTGVPPAPDPWIAALAAGPRREVRPEFKDALRRRLVSGPVPAPQMGGWLGGAGAGLALLFGIGFVWSNLRATRAPESGPGPAVAPVTATVAAADAPPARPAVATPFAEPVEAQSVEPLASAPAPAALVPRSRPAARPMAPLQATSAAPEAPPADPPPASDEGEDDPVAVPTTATPEASPTQVGVPDAPPATATPLPLVPFPTGAPEYGGEAPAPPGP
jgi:hypothetical protein